MLDDYRAISLLDITTVKANVSEALVTTSSNVTCSACLPPHIRHVQEVLTICQDATCPKFCQQPLKSSCLSRILIKNSFKFSSVSMLPYTIIPQIALQRTSAHSSGVGGRVGRNENVTGFFYAFQWLSLQL